MGKTTKTWTVDTEVANWIAQFHNQSDKINQILNDSMGRSKNPEDMLLKLQNQEDKILEQKQQIFDQLFEKTKKGNEEERKKAQEILKVEKAKKQEKRKKLEKLLKNLKNCDEWDEFISSGNQGQNIEELMNYALKFQEIGIKIGAYNLKEMFEYFTIKELKNV